jgi:hypothetical protein
VLAVQLFFTVSDVSARDQIPESGIRRGLTDVEWRQVMQQIIIYRETYLKALHPEDDDCFGISVAISGDTLVVGAYGEDTTAIDSGAVYVFVRTGSTWTQEAFLKASNVDAYDFFGCAVAVSGDTVVVGAHGEDSNGTEADNSLPLTGAAYVFEKDNLQPIAHAGPDQSVEVSTPISLNGSPCSDPDGDTPLNNHWWQEWGTAVSLSGADTAAPSFTTPDSPDTLTFSLVVTDSLGLESEPDMVVIEVQFDCYLPMVIQ